MIREWGSAQLDITWPLKPFPLHHFSMESLYVMQDSRTESPGSPGFRHLPSPGGTEVTHGLDCFFLPSKTFTPPPGFVWARAGAGPGPGRDNRAVVHLQWISVRIKVPLGSVWLGSTENPDERRTEVCFYPDLRVKVVREWKVKSRIHRMTGIDPRCRQEPPLAIEVILRKCVGLLYRIIAGENEYARRKYRRKTLLN